MPLGYPVVRPLAVAVNRALSQRKGWSGQQPFTPGLWNHAAAIASGGSQILGANRYRIFSPDGAYSAVQINNLLAGKNTKLFQFRLTVESITAGTSIIMGDDVGNDITVTGVGTHTGTWLVNGPTATVKRSSGVTDVIVKNVQLIEVNRSPVTAADIALGDADVDTGYVIGSADILAGVTDPDGDTLTIAGYAVHTGSATITGSGPYTLTPTGAGAGTASFTISDGRGGVVTRGVTWTGVAANTNPVAPTFALGDLTVGVGLVQSSTDLLAGATDADGDTLTVTSVTAVSGGTVSGTGPWTITPSATGAGSATVVISDGRGGSVNRTVTWNGVEAAVFKLVPTSTGKLDSRLPLGTVDADLSVAKTLTQGGTITLTSASSRFTNAGMPSRIVFTDFSHGTVGQPASLTTQIGAFDRAQHQGSPTFAPGGLGGRPGVYLYNHVTDEKFSAVIRNEAGHSETFVASAIRIPPGKTMGALDVHWTETGGVPTPGFVNITRSWLKLFWNLVDNSSSISDLILSTLSGVSSSISGNSNSTGDGADIAVRSFLDVNGGWNYYSGWCQHNAATPANGKKWQRWTTSIADLSKSAVGPVFNDDGIDTPFNELSFAGWIEGNTQCQVIAGYSYAAFGLNAPCRIEFGNHPVRERCKKIAHCPPTAVAAGAMSARENYGELDTTKPIFAFAYDRDNVVTATVFINPEVANAA